MDARSLADLLRSMKDEGHPMLWHVLLYAGYAVTSCKQTLPVVSGLIAGASVSIFVFKSPFPLWLKAMFVLGALPLYEYSVMARNYGISMLLLFLFAQMYASRRQHPIRLGMTLALLCNTNIHSLILAALLMALWFWDFFVREGASPLSREARPLYLAVAIVSLGAVTALWTLWPTGQNLPADAIRCTVPDVIKALGATLRDPATAFPNIAPRAPGFLAVSAGLLLVCSTLGLVLQPALLAVAWLGLVALSVFFQVVYRGSLRHQGLFAVFLVALYWIALASRGVPRRHNLANAVARVGLFVGLPGLLAILIATGGYKIYMDLAHEQSASKAFGAFLGIRPQYAGSILIGEPDYFLESVHYYAPNPIYIVREQRFGNTVRFTRTAAKDLGMRDLLRIAWDVHTREDKSVLIALGHQPELAPRSPPPDDPPLHSISYSFGRTFSWSRDDLRVWNSCTRPLEEFAQGVIGDEVYGVYELVAPPR